MDHGDDPLPQYRSTPRPHATRCEEMPGSTKPQFLSCLRHLLRQRLGRNMAPSNSICRENNHSPRGPPRNSRRSLRRGVHGKESMAKWVMVAINEKRCQRVLLAMRFVPMVGTTDGTSSDATSAHSSIGPISKMGVQFGRPFQATRGPYWE